MIVAFGGPNANGWDQLLYLGAALVLSAAIGFERELRGKSAGIRTNAVIGLASALVMEVSKFGFGDVAGEHVSLDPSRVAAQVVSGIGFVGAGLIFVHRGTVRGLTTASTAWMAAAIGLACGAGLPALAAIATVMHFAVVVGLSRLDRRSDPSAVTARFRAPDDRVAARAASACEHAGIGVAAVRSEPASDGVRASVELTATDAAAIFELLSTVPGLHELDVSAGSDASSQTESRG
jgi:putative Mg2+ transporter-C (MgtC) family protein